MMRRAEDRGTCLGPSEAKHNQQVLAFLLLHYSQSIAAMRSQRSRQQQLFHFSCRAELAGYDS